VKKGRKLLIENLQVNTVPHLTLNVATVLNITLISSILFKWKIYVKHFREKNI
jgi:hypothetical protein